MRRRCSMISNCHQPMAMEASTACNIHKPLATTFTNKTSISNNSTNSPWANPFVLEMVWTEPKSKPKCWGFIIKSLSILNSTIEVLTSLSSDHSRTYKTKTTPIETRGSTSLHNINSQVTNYSLIYNNHNHHSIIHSNPIPPIGTTKQMRKMAKAPTNSWARWESSARMETKV